jgi:hypothetical protein
VAEDSATYLHKIFRGILWAFYEDFMRIYEEQQAAAGPPATPWLRTPPPTYTRFLGGFYGHFMRIL